MQRPTASLTPKEEPSPGLVARLAFPLAFVAVGMMVAALFFCILKINNGTFIYTLDDPYIHLALSDQIRHGNYGLYPGTHAAPSSSILFPFLLSVAAGTPLHPYFPLVINIGALFFTLEVMRRFLLHLKLGQDDFAIAVQAAVVALMAPCFNIVGVAFSGLEHSLHIAVVAAAVYGLALFLDTDKVPPWLPAVLVIGPLVRYETIVLSAAALLVLALRGRIRIAGLTFLATAFPLIGFSLFLVKLGLPPLPSSILTKSPVAAGSVGAQRHLLTEILKNADFMTTHSTGVLLLLIGVVVTVICVRELFITPASRTSRGLMAFVLLAMIGGQAAAGRLGWLERYEDYLIVGTAMVCIYLGQGLIRQALAPGRADRFLLAAATAAALVIFGARYWEMTTKLPLAANNIYEQQLQMHYFVDDFYRGPVAVNDLGLASYHNPYPVLDLGGLGSEPARKMLAAHATAADYEAFVAAHGVHLIMVYQEWFVGSIPDTWQKVGTLYLSHGAVSAAQSEVQFYVTDDATADKVRKELAAFHSTLPPHVDINIEEDP